MRTSYHIMVVTAATILVAACAARPSRVSTSYVSPTLPSAPFRKTVAVFIGGDSALRRAIEGRLVQRLPNAVPSYTLIPDSRLGDPERVRGDLMSAGFDGALVLSLLSVQSSSSHATSSPAAPSETLWEYLRRTPRIALTPGRETVITIVSRIYSVTDGKLLWAGRSESFNPLSIRELVDMHADAAADEARRHRRFF